MTVGDLAQKLYEAYRDNGLGVIAGIEGKTAWDRLAEHERARWAQVALMALAVLRKAVGEGEVSGA